MKRIIIFVGIVIAAISIAETNPPSVYFTSILGQLKISSEEGYLIIGDMWASNLPQSASGGKIIFSKGGSGLYEFKWTTGTGEPPNTEMKISQAVDLKTGQHEGMPTITEPGDYSLDFFVEDRKFCTFPFKVSKLDSFIFTEGAWSDWGYLTYPDADPNRELSWKIWLRNYSAEPKKEVKVFVEIVRDKDKKLICSANPNVTWTLQREWERFQFDMMNPPGHPSGEEYTKAKYLLESDGSYTLTMKIGGNIYGTWKFNVKGGKPEYVGRALRGKTDPLTFVEGGGTAFWYEKQK